MACFKKPKQRLKVNGCHFTVYKAWKVLKTVLLEMVLGILPQVLDPCPIFNNFLSYLYLTVQSDQLLIVTCNQGIHLDLHEFELNTPLLYRITDYYYYYLQMTHFCSNKSHIQPVKWNCNSNYKQEQKLKLIQSIRPTPIWSKRIII